MIFVTLGTEKFPFQRLVGWIETLLAGGEISTPVMLQYGHSEVRRLRHPLLTLRESLTLEEMGKTIREAGLVIAHGGDGSTRVLADMHSRFVIVPRESRFGEHVDDHQVDFGVAVARFGVAVCHDFESLRACVLNPPPPFAGPLFQGMSLADHLLDRYPR